MIDLTINEDEFYNAVNMQPLNACPIGKNCNTKKPWRLPGAGLVLLPARLLAKGTKRIGGGAAIRVMGLNGYIDKNFLLKKGPKSFERFLDSIVCTPSTRAARNRMKATVLLPIASRFGIKPKLFSIVKGLLAKTGPLKCKRSVNYNNTSYPHICEHIHSIVTTLEKKSKNMNFFKTIVEDLLNLICALKPRNGKTDYMAVASVGMTLLKKSM